MFDFQHWMVRPDSRWSRLLSPRKSASRGLWSAHKLLPIAQVGTAFGTILDQAAEPKYL